MKHVFLAALLFVATAAPGAEFVEETYFGRIDLGQVRRPDVTKARPVQAERAATAATTAPVYLHVRPEQERRWGAHCRTYDACAVPVYFVTEQWYREVYLPRIGRDDGREQRYRDHIRFERDDREKHHRADDDE